MVLGLRRSLFRFCVVHVAERWLHCRLCTINVTCVRLCHTWNCLGRIVTNFQSISSNGFDFKIPDETIRIINELASQVGSPTYIKTPNFHKKEGITKPLPNGLGGGGGGEGEPTVVTSDTNRSKTPLKNR